MSAQVSAALPGSAQALLNISVKGKDLGWLPILTKVTLGSAGVQREDIIHSIFH